MAGKDFLIKEAVGFGWDVVKKNLKFFIGILIVVGLFYLIPGITESILEDNFPVLAFITVAVAWFIQRILELGLIRISLKFCDNIKNKFSDLLSSAPLVINYIAGTLMYIILCFVGLILLIVPGVILAIRLQFYGYFIVDKALGPIAAFKRSAVLTKGIAFKLFLFGILLGIINVCGALLLLVGLFVSVPLTFVAYAYVYRSLSKQLAV